MPAAALALAGAVLPAHAASPSRPPAVQRLLDCRALTADAARLACFDGAIGSLADAPDGAAAPSKTAMRKNFGLEVRATSAQRRASQATELSDLDGEVASARTDDDGHWIITLAEGGTWRQQDDTVVGRAPRPRTKVKILRGALGGYIMRIGGQPGIRVRRAS